MRGKTRTMALGGLALVAAAASLGILTAGVRTVTAQHLQGDSTAGYDLANKVCIYCHDVDRGGAGLSEKGAPAFQDVADNPGINPISLRVFLRSPHEDMPDIILTETQTDDIVAYIMGLK